MEKELLNKLNEFDARISNQIDRRYNIQQTMLLDIQLKMAGFYGAIRDLLEIIREVTAKKKRKLVKKTALERKSKKNPTKKGKSNAKSKRK